MFYFYLTKPNTGFKAKLRNTGKSASSRRRHTEPDRPRHELKSYMNTKREKRKMYLKKKT